MHHTKAGYDLLVGSEMLEHAKKLLAYLKLDYKVLIDDLAQKIKTYNPKITPEDMKLQEEQGKFKDCWK